MAGLVDALGELKDVVRESVDYSHPNIVIILILTMKSARCCFHGIAGLRNTNLIRLDPRVMVV